MITAAIPKGAPFSQLYRVNPETGCWEWQRYRQKLGYGIIGRNHKSYLAHRYSYELHVGTIPEGLTLDHLCRNRGCVNPSHLEAVTQQVNIRRGHRSRLTPGNVVNIKQSLANGETLTAISEEYAVSHATIWQIAKGNNWSDVTV